MKFIVC